MWEKFHAAQHVARGHPANLRIHKSQYHLSIDVDICFRLDTNMDKLKIRRKIFKLTYITVH